MNYTDYVRLFASNGTASLTTGVSGALLSKLVFENTRLTLPYVEGLDGAWFYGAVFALSSGFMNLTGDFVLPLISKNPSLQSLAKLSQPISVGLLSVALMFIINGFDISLMGAAKGFAVGGVSNIIGQYVANMIYNRGLIPAGLGYNPLAPDTPQSRVSTPMATPLVVSQAPISYNNALNFTGFPKFGQQILGW